VIKYGESFISKKLRGHYVTHVYIFTHA